VLTSGSPKGSMLSPLLFTYIINDIISCVRNCSVHLYADDLQLYFVYINRRGLSDMDSCTC
jgi:hypothetical protein